MPDLLPVARVSSNDRAGIRQRLGSACARPVPPVPDGSPREGVATAVRMGRHLGCRLQAARGAAGKQRPGGRGSSGRNRRRRRMRLGMQMTVACHTQHTPRPARNLWTQ